MLSRQEWFQAGAILLFLWGAALLWLAPRLEQRLNDSAALRVSALDESLGGSRFDRVSVRFDGRQALVSGAVRHEPDARRLLQELASDLRTPGNGWNPVSKVSTRGGLQVRPLDPGWLVAAVRGFDADVAGVCASEQERDAFEESLRRQWPVWRGKITFALQVDTHRFDESPGWLNTVQKLPAPEARGIQSARLLATRIGQPWTSVPLQDDPASAGQLPSAVLGLGPTAAEWSERVQPMHEAVLTYRMEEAAWEAEQERLRQLPPAHVFLGQRGDQVLLRGEVFDLEAKRAVIAAVLAALPGRRLLDDLRAIGGRRPDPGLGALDVPSALASKNGKAFALGLPGQPWTAVDWEVGRDSQPWKELLPPGLEDSKLRDDSALVIDWLQGSNAGIPVLPAPPQPAFITLAVFQGTVLVGGRLAEESLRAQIIAAVKQAYPSGWTIRDQVGVSGACATSESVHHTTHSVPVAAAGRTLFAVALPGETWQPLPLSTVEGLATLSASETLHGIPAQALAVTFEEALEEVRALGLGFPVDQSRGNELPGDKP